MNSQDPLAQLAPLREPELISWWPLAPGWYLLLALIMAALISCYWLWRRHRQASAYRRQALIELAALRRQWCEDGDDANYLLAINSLLKRVALIRYERSLVAAVHSSSWLAFLNRGLKTDVFTDELAQLLYRPTMQPQQIESYSEAAEHWLRQHGELR